MKDSPQFKVNDEEEKKKFIKGDQCQRIEAVLLLLES